MTKDDILTIFQTRFTDPGSYKDGEYLYAHLLEDARMIIRTNREDLIDILKEWALTLSEPYVRLSMDISNELHITEMIDSLKELRAAFANNSIFRIFYVDLIDKIIENLSN